LGSTDFTFESAGSAASAGATVALASRTLLVRVGEAIYGCDILDAQEIIPLRKSARIPGAPPFIRGLINVRGSIVPVIDLGRRFDPARPFVSDGFILLVRAKGGRAESEGGVVKLVGIVVDEVLDVRSLVEESMPGATVEGGLIRGLGRVDDRDVMLLDLQLLIHQALLS
jgi:purine-binding chemotaxis protein CheW